MARRNDIPHFIQHVNGNERPANLLFFDTETVPKDEYKDGHIHQLKLGIAQYYRITDEGQYRQVSELVFNTPNEFAEYVVNIMRSKITLYLISHNLTFDFLAGQLFYTFPANDIELLNFYTKGTTSIFKYKARNGRITALDFANFMPTALAVIGKMVNMPKLEIDFETCTDEQLKVYCRNDVEIMVKAMQLWIAFLDENDLGSFRSTLASTCFNIYRYRFMNHKIYIHKNLEVLALEDKAYHGGRVEATRIGFFNTDIYYKLDINSMYPFVCANEKFPTSLYRTYNHPSLKLLEVKLKDYAVIAEVILKTNEPAYPLIHDKKLIYPTGIFKTTLSTPELLYALDHKHIKAITLMAVYQQHKIFADYMLFFYALRKKYKETGNETFDKICKALMNSLYGKFGQRGIDTHIIGVNQTGQVKIETGYNQDSDSDFTHYYMTDTIFEAVKTGYSYNAFPAIAAHVTAYARMYLYKLKRLAGLSNVYYNDTDSIFTNSIGYNRLINYIDENKLGALKIEEICNWIEIMCPKNYRTPLTDKHKGVRKSAIEFEENTFVQEQFAGLNGMLRIGRLDGTLVKLIEKRLSMRITHGYQPDAAGFVQPFQMHYSHSVNVLLPPPQSPYYQPEVGYSQSSVDYH